MIDINLDKNFILLKQENKNYKMYQVLAQILFDGVQRRPDGSQYVHNTDIIKIYNWSLKLFNEKKITLDKEDIKNILLPVINREASLTLGIKAQLIIEIESYIKG